jgi:sugar lactone lactonase YvrE
MARLLGAVMASALSLLIGWAGAAAAWDRGHVDTFAVLPDYAPGVPESAEGLAVGLDGNIYVPSGGFNADGFVPGPAKLWVFNPAGHLIRTVTLTGTEPPVLGIAFNPANGLAFIADLGNSSIFKWDPVTDTTTHVASLDGAGPNAICFDAAGSVYVPILSRASSGRPTRTAMA